MRALLVLAVPVLARAAYVWGGDVFTTGRDARCIHPEAVLLEPTLEERGGQRRTSGPSGAAVTPTRRRAIVVGAGVAGVCSALALHRSGYEVTVVESGRGAATGSTAAAAGGMQRSNPRVDVATWKATMRCLIPEWLGGVRRHPADPLSFPFFHIKWHRTLSDPHFVRFAWDMLRCSFWEDPAEKRRNQEQLLSFTDWAISGFIGLMRSKGGALAADAALSRDGVIKIVRDQEAASRLAEIEREGGRVWFGAPGADCEPTEYIHREHVLQLAPWLNCTGSSSSVCGGVLQRAAATANSEWFTRSMAGQLRREGVHFLLETTVEGFDVRSDGVTRRVAALHTNKGSVPIHGDGVVVLAAGAWTPLLLRKLSLYAPQYPLKGYDVIMDGVEHLERQGIAVPSRAVVDGNIYITRYAGQLRVASIGEFAGWDTMPDESIAQLVKTASKHILPEALSAHVQAAPVVCGLRPFVADGRLLIGRLPRYSNAYVNTGPGFNGWKVALGAGVLLARAAGGDSGELAEVMGDAPPDLEQCFSPAGRISYSPVLCSIASTATAGIPPTLSMIAHRLRI